MGDKLLKRVDMDPLITDLRSIIDEAHAMVALTVNRGLTVLYWRLGQRLQSEILKGARADYGQQILATVAQALTGHYGKGFSYSSLTRMIKFSDVFSDQEILATLSQVLSWSHFRELLSLEKAVGSLRVALDEYAKKKNVFVRDSIIQRFEYTYELSHKFLKRYLEVTSANPDEVDRLSFQDLIRLGSEQQLLRNGWDQWVHYRKLRGTTRHTYDEDKAEAVLKEIPDFYDEVYFLLNQLQKRNS